ncbi:PDZ domain-containing protein [Pseudoalteromonas sp. SWYJZ98]|uniref:PDZ domain-containing protein n=1 Tax=Pseudoalteromonas sp. SWYJZ98 TaxID=2792060 RepID=UPI0018CC91ED|nr:PDZ domain-containing protein [Pseudoalteromonas sp. SWYJZ98]MBH0031089.1 PDZ domain-containing protein [Pseudoalteromonas sp. SWYJZ98]
MNFIIYFRAVSITLLILLLNACGMAKGVHELRPLASNVERVNVTPNEIEVYTLDNLPSRPIIELANIAAHGNGYANNEVLINTLKEEASKAGAEIVLITNKEISKDEILGTYGNGVMLTNQIQRPHLYGIAAIYSKVRFGIIADNNGLIKYVTSNSAADEAGLKEGMKLLTINGRYFNNTSIFQQEIATKKPNDIIEIEYIDNNNNKFKTKVTLKKSE